MGAIRTLPPRRTNHIGQRFGRLVVVSFAGVRNGQALWKCRCDCGQTAIAPGGSLRNGSTSSCGCLRRESKPRLTHGLENSPEYRCWLHMKGRCYTASDKAFKYYGARGITVCERWRDSFEHFYADLGPRPSP